VKIAYVETLGKWVILLITLHRRFPNNIRHRIAYIKTVIVLSRHRIQEVCAVFYLIWLILQEVVGIEITSIDTVVCRIFVDIALRNTFLSLSILIYGIIKLLYATKIVVE
jgi:uncharacterized protein YhhL (DUF1145 family)